MHIVELAYFVISEGAHDGDKGNDGEKSGGDFFTDVPGHSNNPPCNT